MSDFQKISTFFLNSLHFYDTILMKGGILMIGKYICKRREELGMSQEQLAKLLGVGKSAICNYEKDVSSPKESVMIKLFEALQCDANYFYTDYIVDIESEKAENMLLSQKEISVIKAYRSQPEMQLAVNKLLGIEENK